MIFTVRGCNLSVGVPTGTSPAKAYVARACDTRVAVDPGHAARSTRTAKLRTLWPNGLGCFLLAQVAQSPLQRLEPQQRVKLLGSLILLTIGGVSLVVLAWLWMRVGRRNSRREDRVLQHDRKAAQVDDWARKPLTKPDGNGDQA